MVKRLLQYEVDLQAHGGKYGSALDAASAKGYENIRWIVLDFERNMAQWSLLEYWYVIVKVKSCDHSLAHGNYTGSHGCFRPKLERAHFTA
jgi:hypothetical protein